MKNNYTKSKNKKHITQSTTLHFSPSTYLSKKSSISIFGYIFFGLYFVASIALLGYVCLIGILPEKFFLIVAGALLTFAILFALVTFIEKSVKALRVICIALEILLSSVSIYSFTAISQIQNFFSNIQVGEYQIENFYVLVNTDSTVEDFGNLGTIAVYKDVSDTYTKAVDEFKNKSSANMMEYGDFVDAGTALIERKTDSLLLRGTLKDTVSEIIPNFDKKTKILSTIGIKVKKEAIEVPDIDITAEPFNIYISGIDTYGDISIVSRSDVNMIATINPKTNQILLTSIPRDYYVQLHGTEGLKDKLTHAGIYGVDMSRQTLEDLFGINIDYYIRVNFSTVVDIINSIDGIDITPDTSFTAWTNHACSFTANEPIHLYGDCALAYARERYSYAEGDRHRVQNQQDVLNAIIHKISTNKSLVLKYSDLLGAIGNNIETNIPNSQIYKLINKQLDTMPSWIMSKNQVDGAGSMDYTYSMPSQPLYVMIPDAASIATASDMIAKILNPNPDETSNSL